jgi:hypothetical protein
VILIVLQTPIISDSDISDALAEFGSERKCVELREKTSWQNAEVAQNGMRAKRVASGNLEERLLGEINIA